MGTLCRLHLGTALSSRDCRCRDAGVVILRACFWRMHQIDWMMVPLGRLQCPSRIFSWHSQSRHGIWHQKDGYVRRVFEFADHFHFWQASDCVQCASDVRGGIRHGFRYRTARTDRSIAGPSLRFSRLTFGRGRAVFGCMSWRSHRPRSSAPIRPRPISVGTEFSLPR